MTKQVNLRPRVLGVSDLLAPDPRKAEGTTMISLAGWLPPALVGTTFTLLGTLKLYGFLKGVVGGADKPFVTRLCRDMTDRGKPQSAAGIAVALPGDRAGQPCLAGA